MSADALRELKNEKIKKRLNNKENKKSKNLLNKL